MRSRNQKAIAQGGRIQAAGYDSMDAMCDPEGEFRDRLLELTETILPHHPMIDPGNVPMHFNRAARQWPNYIAAKRAAKRDTA